MDHMEWRELSKQVWELLEKGFIKQSIYEWGAPFVFATMADGSLRLCVNYRLLNNSPRKIDTRFRGLMIYLIRLLVPRYFLS